MFLWLRLVVLVVFCGYVAYEGMTIVAVLAALLIVLTIWQLIMAYR